MLNIQGNHKIKKKNASPLYDISVRRKRKSRDGIFLNNKKAHEYTHIHKLTYTHIYFGDKIRKGSRKILFKQSLVNVIREKLSTYIRDDNISVYVLRLLYIYMQMFNDRINFS